MITWETTDRGFARGEFKDRYGKRCSIQASSLATEDCIWLGCDVDNEDREVVARMHLTRQMAGTLALALLGFAMSGELPQI